MARTLPNILRQMNEEADQYRARSATKQPLASIRMGLCEASYGLCDTDARGDLRSNMQVLALRPKLSNIMQGHVRIETQSRQSVCLLRTH